MSTRKMSSDGRGDDSGVLDGYEVVVAVCGGIAAYKVAHLVSALVQRGAGVTVAMTEAATRLVGPATFQALTARPVLTSLWSGEYAYDPQHVRLTREADLLVIAPATANIIGKLAGGICDDLVSTIAIAAGCPIVVVPSMNDRMWAHPAVQANAGRLEEFGYTLIGPAEGWLACRCDGPGRMVEPDAILQTVTERLVSAPPRLANPIGD